MCLKQYISAHATLLLLNVLLSHLQDVGNNVLLTLFKKRVFIKIGVDLQDLSENFRHLRLGE